MLQAFYSIRSERQLVERIDYGLLFRWSVGLGIQDAVWDATAFTKNRGRTWAHSARDFHGERRRNDTHISTTDPDARLYRKGPGKEARLCFMGHALMENRNGLIIGR